MATKRNKLFLGITGLVAAAGLSATLGAQETPESLLPPGFDQPTPAPTPAPRPAPPRPTPEPRAPAPDSDPDDGADVEATTGTTDSDGDGISDAGPAGENGEEDFSLVDAGFSLGGEAPWGSVDGRFHKILMRRLDVPLASRWAHIGLRNALLADAAAPGALDEQDWLAERAWLLLRMGEADAARLLLAGTDTARYSPKLAQVALQTAMATSDPAALCPVAPSLDESEARAEPLVRAICAALSAQPEIASDSISRARRRGTVDTIDLALVDKLIGAGSGTGRATTLEWEPVERLNSWRYGLATGTGVLPPEALMDGAAPNLRAWAARAALLTSDQRLPFARTATGLGVFSGEALVDLYALDYDRTAAEDLSGTDAFTLRRAFVAPSLGERLEAMRTFWSLGDDSPYERMASLAATSLAVAQIRPNSALEADVSDIVASLLTAGYVEQALRWRSALEDMDEEESDLAWAQLALAAPGNDLDIGRVGDFISRDDSRSKRRSAVLLAGLAGLGKLDDARVASIEERQGLGVMRETGLTRLLSAAASRGEQGTVLLLAASALQSRDVASIPPHYLRAIAAGLRAVDQEFLARMILAEAVARV
ncbi:hypothetical protein WJS89_11370 [Sphingomicrobium sp. XHP0235]|uniref:hypothetical protein n=1 Tax=Sphingomicrobium aquimarinum TaxID=3133971 RepID=UPI0031FE67E9